MTIQKFFGGGGSFSNQGFFQVSIMYLLWTLLLIQKGESSSFQLCLEGCL